MPVWILTAMAAGLGLGGVLPGLAGDLDAVMVGSVSLRRGGDGRSRHRHHRPRPKLLTTDTLAADLLTAEAR